MFFSFDKNKNCVDNAFANAKLVKEEGGLAKVILVQTEMGKHAYLVVDDNVYNEGVTWGDDRYPDYSIQQLNDMIEMEYAEDLTEELYRAEREDDLYHTNEGSFKLR